MYAANLQVSPGCGVSWVTPVIKFDGLKNASKIITGVSYSVGGEVS